MSGREGGREGERGRGREGEGEKVGEREGERKRGGEGGRERGRKGGREEGKNIYNEHNIMYMYIHTRLGIILTCTCMSEITSSILNVRP